MTFVMSFEKTRLFFYFRLYENIITIWLNVDKSMSKSTQKISTLGCRDY